MILDASTRRTVGTRYLMMPMIPVTVPTTANVEAGNTATREMLGLFDGLLSERRKQPTNDLLTILAGRGDAEERRDDLLANSVFFVLAGHATTTALLACGVQLLSTHPDQLA